jgi:hypothetical protein
LPNLTLISDIIGRIARISEKAILENGGEKQVRNGGITYIIPVN